MLWTMLFSIMKKPVPYGTDLSGASDLTRTGDLLITSEMHYRLCYTSRPKYYSHTSGKCQQLFCRRRNSLTYGRLCAIMRQRRSRCSRAPRTPLYHTPLSPPRIGSAATAEGLCVFLFPNWSALPSCSASEKVVSKITGSSVIELRILL